MTVPGAPLATLREPSPDEASRWHKVRNNPVAVRFKFLLEFLLEEPTIRLVKRTDAATELVADPGGGMTLRLTLREDLIEARVGPYAVEQGGEPLDRDAFLDDVSGLIEVLQLGTGFYVFSEELVGFDPIGACPACGLEVFEWQEECGICDAVLHVPRPGEDEHDSRAQRVVDVLLRREMLELACPRGRKNVERTVASYYAYAGTSIEALLGVLIDLADVAEVYCDEGELGRVLQRVR